MIRFLPIIAALLFLNVAPSLAAPAQPLPKDCVRERSEIIDPITKIFNATLRWKGLDHNRTLVKSPLKNWTFELYISAMGWVLVKTGDVNANIKEFCIFAYGMNSSKTEAAKKSDADALFVQPCVNLGFYPKIGFSAVKSLFAARPVTTAQPDLVWSGKDENGHTFGLALESNKWSLFTQYWFGANKKCQRYVNTGKRNARVGSFAASNEF